MTTTAGVAFAKVSYAPAESRSGKAGPSVLRNVSLRLEAGTTTAVLGRSGSGKTTLLRMVNGLVRPSSGEIWVGETRVCDVAADAAKLQALRRSIGYVIQENGLFPHMTVERNAGLALELAGAPKQAMAARVAEVLGMVGMEFAAFRGRYPLQLSGGQRQRVGLARALATDPAVLLMDEPFGALDPMTRAEMQTMVRELLAQVKKTVLLVTHDLNEALFLADRVVFLDSGTVVADVAAREVLGSEIPAVKEYVAAVRRATSE
jgi:osmoprotectant transport system ATP-binding protein